MLTRLPPKPNDSSVSGRWIFGTILSLSPFLLDLIFHGILHLPLSMNSLLFYPIGLVYLACWYESGRWAKNEELPLWKALLCMLWPWGLVFLVQAARILKSDFLLPNSEDWIRRGYIVASVAFIFGKKT